MEDTTLLFDLHDADGIRSRDPVRLVLAARADDVPVVALRLRGISTAITPQARLPVVGDVRDDYGLSRLWFEYQFDKPNAATKTAADSADAAAKERRLHPTASRRSTAVPPADQPAVQPFHTSALPATAVRAPI